MSAAAAAVAAPAPMPQAAQGAAPMMAAPSPQYTPPPAPAPPPSMEGGGETKSRGGGAIREFFSDINVVDVAVSAFVVAAILYSIQYHRFMMMLEKSGYADLSSRVQKLESALAAAKKKAEVNASGSGMQKKRALISL